jgi:hypothetical protein
MTVAARTTSRLSVFAWLGGSDAPERRRFGRAVAIVKAAMNLSSWPGVRDREEDV